jgi:Rieske Fe-S protein
VTQEPRPGMETTRRGALAGIGLAGVAATLTACGGSSSSAAGTASAAPAGSTPAGAAGASAAASSPAPAGGGAVLGTTSQIPVGGGMVFTAAKVVVTQPTAGQFKGFTAICTHLHCIVDKVANGTIDCPCHGSKYSVKDGSVVNGPAPMPLAAQPITVSGEKISLA